MDDAYRGFAEKYKLRLDERQAAAVCSADVPTLLVAVPGSGKTTALTARLGYLVHVLGVDPGNILAMTYSVSAAKDMRRRYESVFGDDGIAFRTINGVCDRIIKRYGRLTGKEPFRLVSDERESAYILRSVYKDVRGSYPTDADVKQLRTDITYLKNTGCDPEELGRDMKEMAERYGRILRGSRLMDYDDQIVYAHRILRKSPGMLDELRRRYTHICVDEAQDTSKLQHEMIRMLTGRKGSIFMVGDEDQSIYGFRAAWPDALARFEQDHDGARVMFLEKNYRSCKSVVAAADGFIKKNKGRREKKMIAERSDQGTVERIRVPDRMRQYEEAVKLLVSSDRQTAVLYRDNECALPLIDLLDRAGADFSVNMRSETMSFFTHRAVTDTENMIRFALDPTDTDAFSEIYYKIGSYLTKDQTAQITAIARSRGLSVFGAAYASGLLPFGVMSRMRELKESFARVRAATASDALDILYRELGYEEWISDRGTGAEKLPILRATAAGCRDIASFSERLRELKDITEAHKDLQGRRIVLSTVHSSKGLEYDTVILTDVFDGMLPKTDPADAAKPGSPEEREYMEERRLFYVAVTRAKNALYVFSADSEPSSFCAELFDRGRDKPASNEPFYPGERVRHPVFGSGAVSKTDREYKTVDFDLYGRKKLDRDIVIKNSLLKEVKK